MSPISLDDYFGQYRTHADVTDARMEHARDLLDRVNALMEEAFADGVGFQINKATGNYIAGSGNGGFRPKDCTEGAPNSSHKEALAVDVFDGQNMLGGPFAVWCSRHLDKLEKHGLYMEHPSATKGKWTNWCHLTTREPGSGKRVFFP